MTIQILQFPDETFYLLLQELFQTKIQQAIQNQIPSPLPPLKQK
jgi:hypothetical protein